MGALNCERRVAAKPVQVRADEEGKNPRIEGYAAVFNSPTTITDREVGEFSEVILPGAFTKSLADGADVRLLLNHEGAPLARTRSGTLKVEEDEIGLKFSAELDPTDPDVQALLPKLRRGDLDQCSFAFDVANVGSDSEGQSWRNVDGKLVRELSGLLVHDVSVVTFPAYPDTSVALRSLQSHKSQERSRIQKLIRHRLDLDIALAEID